MNLEELKRVVDFFYENATRYGANEAGVTDIKVLAVSPDKTSEVILGIDQILKGPNMGDPLYIISSSEAVEKFKAAIVQEVERLAEINKHIESGEVKDKKTSPESDIIPEEVAVFNEPEQRILSTPKMRTNNASSKVKPTRPRKGD